MRARLTTTIKEYPRRTAAGAIVLVITLATAIFSLRQPPQDKVYMPALGQYRPQSKAGLAWSSTNCGDQLALDLVARGGWYHNWWPRPNSCPDQPAHVPNWRPGNASAWNKPTSYSGYCLFLNEPDRPDQDNLAASVAASKWLQFRQASPLCRAIVLNLSRGDNTAYAAEWRETIKQWTGSYPDIAGWGIHLYGNRQEILSQLAAFENWLATTGQTHLQIWGTEFSGCFASHRVQLSAGDLQMVINEFEARLDRYAFFPVRWNKPGEPPPPSPVCAALFQGDTNNLTVQGTVFKGGPSGYPGPQEQPETLGQPEGYP